MNQPSNQGSFSPPWLLILGLLLGGGFLVFMARDSIAPGTERELKSSSAHLVKLTDQNFQKEVVESEIPVVVDFWADWCGPCKAIAPTIDGLAEKYQGKIKVGKVDFDENPELVKKYRVTGIPVVMIFHGNEKPLITLVNGHNIKTKLAGAIENVLAGN